MLQTADRAQTPPADSITSTLFTTPDVVALTGVSYRMLDYWCRNGTIEPALPARGSGSIRRFTPAQVAGLQVAAHVLRLMGGGTNRPEPLAHVRRIVDWFIDHPDVRDGILFVAPGEEPALLDATIPDLDIDVRLLTNQVAWLIDLHAVIHPATDDPLLEEAGHVRRRI